MLKVQQQCLNSKTVKKSCTRENGQGRSQDFSSGVKIGGGGVRTSEVQRAKARGLKSQQWGEVLGDGAARPLPTSEEVWGSAINSPSGLWGTAKGFPCILYMPEQV